MSMIISMTKNGGQAGKRFLLAASLLLLPAPALHAQDINWLTFGQLEDSLRISPKKVLIYFYTDWCTYCRKMEREVFSKPAVKAAVSGACHAVKFNGETRDSVRFEGRLFVNSAAESRRNGIHQLAMLLAGRDGSFAPPVVLLLGPGFRVYARHSGYLDSKHLLQLLEAY